MPATSRTKSTPLSIALQRLEPTGVDSFEALIATILEELTAVRYRQARSGNQRGRDLDSDRSHPGLIVVECKRYRHTTKLNERDLCAEIEIAAREDEDLDLWVLATSRSVDATLVQSLQKATSERGLDFGVLSCGTLQNPGTLDFLCALAADSVVGMVAQTPAIATDKLERYLQALRIHKNFEREVVDLRRMFAASTVGFPTLRSNLNAELSRAMADVLLSRTRFHSPLHVAASNIEIPSIHRTEVENGLGDFLAQSNAGGGKNLCIVHGEEGDGKSWAVASWVNERVIAQNVSAVFWLYPGQASDGSVLSDLSRLPAEQSLRGAQADFEKKLKRWGSSGSGNHLLVVLDGINERRDSAFWGSYVTNLLAQFHGCISIVLTCRTNTWKGRLKDRIHHPYTEIAVRSFNDTEFSKATAHFSTDSAARIWQLGPLLRKPRYLAVAARHISAFGSAEELTIPRLFYEDWKSRLHNKADLSLDSIDFEALLRQLATKARDKEPPLSNRQVAEELPSREHAHEILEELSTGGVLRRGKDGRFEVNEPFLVAGMGLLLVDVAEMHDGDLHSRIEALIQWLGDTESWPIGAQVCAAAATRALTDAEIESDAAIALLIAFSRCQNIDLQSIQEVMGLAARDPERLCRFTELLWAELGVDHFIERAVLSRLIALLETPASWSVLTKWFQRWAGFVHLYGEFERPVDSPLGKRRRTHLEELLPAEGAVASLPSINVSLIRVADQRLLRLSRLVLACLSFADRRAYWPVLMTSMYAAAMMGGSRFGTISWILSSSREPVLDLTLEAVARLKQVPSEAALRVTSVICASTMEPALHSFAKEAERELANFREPLGAWAHALRVPTSEDLPAYLDDESVAMHLRLSRAKSAAANPLIFFSTGFKRTSLTLLSALDASRMRCSRSSNDTDNSWETLEPIVCRLDASAYAQKINEFALTGPTRDRSSLFLFALILEHLAPIIEAPALAAVRESWAQAVAALPTQDEDIEAAESWLLIPLMQKASAREQIGLLIRRGDAARDSLRLEPHFKRLESTEDEAWLVSQAQTSPHALQAALWFSAAQIDVTESLWRPLVEQGINSSSTATRGLSLQLLGKFSPDTVAQLLPQLTHPPADKICTLERYFRTILLLKYSPEPAEVLVGKCDLGLFGSILGKLESPNSASLVQAYVDRLMRALEELIHSDSVPPTAPSMKVSSPSEHGRAEWPGVAVNWDATDNGVSFKNEFSTWGGIASGSAEDFTQAFDSADNNRELQEALESAYQRALRENNWLFAAYWSKLSLQKMTALCPQISEQTIALLDEGRRRRRISHIASFAESLARHLVGEGDDTGWDILRALEGTDSGVTMVYGHSGMRAVEVDIYRCEPVAHAASRWKQNLEGARSDLQVFEICAQIEAGGNSAWLRELALSDSTSTAPYYRKRSILLAAAVLNDEEFVDLLLPYQLSEYKDDAVMAQAQEHRTRERSMRWWIARGIEATEPMDSLCAARLLLRCADARVWHYLSETRKNSTVSERERYDRFVAFFSDEDLRNAVKRNGKDVAKKLLGCSVQEDDAAPWLKL